MTRVRQALLIIAMSLSSFLILGEIGVRLLARPRPPMFRASTNPRLVYELHPAYPEINSLGMRDREVDRASLPTQYTIAVIGDSHAYSTAVPQRDASFPAQLEQALHQRGYPNVRVLNFGVPGYNMAQELEVLHAKVLALTPQLIILQYCINDTHVCNYLQPAHPRLHRLLYTSQFLVTLWQGLLYSPLGKRYALDWVGTHIPDALLFQPDLVGTLKVGPDDEPSRRRHPARTPERVPARYHYMLGDNTWQRHVRLFAQTAQARGIPLLATGFIEAAERQVFQREGFDVYAFTDIFQGQDTRPYGYHPEDTATHFDATGCRLIGQALATYLAAHYPLPPHCPPGKPNCRQAS